MRNRINQKRRRGMASMDVVFIVGTLFPICMVLYYIAEKCLSNLYEIISVVIGCPAM